MYIYVELGTQRVIPGMIHRVCISKYTHSYVGIMVSVYSALSYYRIDYISHVIA